VTVTVQTAFYGNVDAVGAYTFNPGAFASFMFFSFVDEAPLISSVVPSVGLSTGTTLVTVIGSSLCSGPADLASVSFGPGTAAVVVAASEVAVVVNVTASDAVGRVNVSVSSVAHGLSSLAGAFTFVLRM